MLKGVATIPLFAYPNCWVSYPVIPSNKKENPKFFTYKEK